jgi:CheY-like chemotaxis protein
MSKPMIVYVDDEPRNLAVFEASVPDTWDLKCFDSAIEALKQIKQLQPWVILSDQRMPGMTGLEFLEVASQILPNTVRIVVTGQSEEGTIVQLIRRAKIFDYITKPWTTEDLIVQIEYGIEYYRALTERNAALSELKTKYDQLEQVSNKLKEANHREVELRKEICAWAPAPIVQALLEGKLELPSKRDLIGITYDIVGSSALSGKSLQGKPIKSHIYRLFSECLLKKGGIRESSSGDSVYGHFGAVDGGLNSYVAALTAAQEFRVALRGFSSVHGIEIECGIALHLCKQATVQFHEIRAETPLGPITQKSFDTESPDIDLLHRIEKLTHELSGTNIIMSKAFLDGLAEKPAKYDSLGFATLKGQPTPVELFLIRSDRVSEVELSTFLAAQLKAA